MKYIFTLLDIYGTKFHFFINNQTRFKTFFGGILTIILCILIIIAVFIFGKDFFLRKNPSYTYSSISENYEKINLKKEKILIAFKILDSKGNQLINNSNYIYPEILYYKSNFNQETKMYNNTVEKISYYKCNLNELNKDFESNKNEEIFCIQLQNKTFGGSMSNDFFDYFDIQFNYCKNGGNYYFNNSNCASIEEINSFFINDTITFYLYYSTVDFRSKNLKNPFKNRLNIHLNEINYKFRKTDKIYIKKNILEDDQGWLFSSKKNISAWGADKIVSDYKYISYEDLKENNYSSMFYNFQLYMSLDKNYYSRKYTKIQEIIAIFGGLLTFFQYIGKNINNIINTSLKKINIVEKFIEFQNKKKRIIYYNKINLNISNNNSINNLNDSIILNYNNCSNCYYNLFPNTIYNNNSDNKITIKKKFNSQIYSQNRIINIIQNINLNEHIRKSYSIGYLSNNSFLVIDIKKRINKILCCNNLYKKIGSHKPYKYNIHELVDFLYYEKCGLNNYFNFLNDITILKELIFNHYQNLSLNFTKKLNINDEQNIKTYLMDDIEKSNKIIEYFKEKFKNKSNSNIDNFIFNRLDNQIKYKITSLKK